MPEHVSIAIVGDRDPSADAHLATEASLAHSGTALGLAVTHRWLHTSAPAAGGEAALRARARTGPAG